MKIKGYILLGGTILAGVLVYKNTNECLNDIYEPHNRFDPKKAELIEMGHKVVSGILAINTSATVFNTLANIMIKKQ